MSADGGARSAPTMKDRVPGEWSNSPIVSAMDFTCSFCGSFVGSNRGYTTTGNDPSIIRICPRCNRPTYFDMTAGMPRQFPDSVPGGPVYNIPSDLRELFNEARQSAGAGAYTGAVMLCRKLLMNISVKEGANEGQTFVQYIKYLEDNHYFSPKSRGFVTYIKDLGNEANHQIAAKTREDAIAAIEFVRALLSHNYELPAKIPVSITAATPNPPTPGNSPTPRPGDI